MELLTGILSTFIAKDNIPIIVQYVGDICSHVDTVNGLNVPMYALTDKVEQPHDISSDRNLADETYFCHEIDNGIWKYIHPSGSPVFTIPWISGRVNFIIHQKGILFMFPLDGNLWIIYEGPFGDHTITYAYYEQVCPIIKRLPDDRIIIRYDSLRNVFHEIQVDQNGIHLTYLHLKFLPEFKTGNRYQYEKNHYEMEVSLSDNSNNRLIAKVTATTAAGNIYLTLTSEFRFAETATLHLYVDDVIPIDYHNKLYSIINKHKILECIMESRRRSSIRGPCSCM